MIKEGLYKRVRDRLGISLTTKANNARIKVLSQEVAQHKKAEEGKPVLFFNASTRLSRVSLNAAFSRLVAWSLALQGMPVKHLVCQKGLKPCVLGTNRKDKLLRPPCHACVLQSDALFEDQESIPFTFEEDPVLESVLEGLSLEALYSFEHLGIPLGPKVLPAVRWILRRHHLEEDETTMLTFVRLGPSRNILKKPWMNSIPGR